MEISFDSLHEMFETKTRDSGESFVALKDDAPEWAQDFVREAHGTEILPDDYRYQWIRDALEALAASPDATPQEIADEFADDVSIYTADLLDWLKSNLTRCEYVDQARAEGIVADSADIVQRIQAGQYLERREVFQGVLDAIDGLEV